MRIADLFAGCGGMSTGFSQAGFEIGFAAEAWEPAAEVYEANLNHDVARLDLGNMLKTVRALRAIGPEVIAGGPPCQDFSQAGARREASRAHLTLVFGEIVRALRPQWFVMENVPEVQGSKVWTAARSLLSEGGYGISEVKLNAAYYGVPQIRKRFFAVGRLDVDDSFLEEALSRRITLESLTVRQFVGDEFGIDYYYRHPRTWGRRAVFSLDEPSPTVRSTNRPVPPGYKGHPLDPVCHLGIRPLTPRERARIQTFPKEHVFEGSRTDLDMMIANAVPVKLAEHVAEAIRCYEEGHSLRPEDEFRRWLRQRHDFTPRAAGDVLSRLRRASRLLGEPHFQLRAPEEALRRLRRVSEYSALPRSVRSQIKRAIELHAEFRGAQDDLSE